MDNLHFNEMIDGDVCFLLDQPVQLFLIVKPKNIKLGFASFPLSTQYKEASSKTGWLRIWIVFEWSQLSTRGMLFQ
jgi:hypothetical protein